jgi:plastocyanin
MGLVSRRTARAAALAAAAAPLVAMSVLLPGTAAARPAQTADGKIGTTATLKFDPATLTVPAGTKVTWTNTGGGFHTVTGGENGQKDPNSPMDGTIDSEGKTYSVTFDEAGTYKYFCAPHLTQGMTGEIVVTATGKGTAGTASPKAGTSQQPGESSSPTATASASASVGAPQQGAGAPTPNAEGEEDHHLAPGIEGNPTLERIEAERAAQHGAVSGFRFFTMVAAAFLVILAAAVLFSTRPRRAGK